MRVFYTKGDIHMSKNDKVLVMACFTAALGVGAFLIPKMQKKCSNKIYKSYNRKVLRDKYGIEIDRK